MTLDAPQPGSPFFAAALALLALAGGSLAGCSDRSAELTLQGYVEGEFVRLAPEASGRLTAITVAKGDDVAAGAPLFALDTRDQDAALAEAKSDRDAAAASLADLKTGRRPEEIAVLQANVAEAKAAQTAAQKTYDRNNALETRAVASAAALDAARADLDAANARLDAANRNLAVGELAARPEAIAAAEATLAARAAAVTAAETALARRHVAAPAAAHVDDVYFRVGELVPAGSPVVSLLPPENRKIVFFVPEPARSSVKAGERIALTCDGCAGGLAATITRIASAAEFSPPVIYSTTSRARLVWRVEARPEGAAAALSAGQPVDVTLEGGAP